MSCCYLEPLGVFLQEVPDPARHNGPTVKSRQPALRWLDNPDLSYLTSHQSAVLHATGDAETDGWLDLPRRIASSVPECVLVDEAKLMKGPAYVAWELAQAAKLDEQLDIVAFFGAAHARCLFQAA